MITQISSLMEAEVLFASNTPQGAKRQKHISFSERPVSVRLLIYVKILKQNKATLRVTAGETTLAREAQ